MLYALCNLQVGWLAAQIAWDWGFPSMWNFTCQNRNSSGRIRVLGYPMDSPKTAFQLVSYQFSLRGSIPLKSVPVTIPCPGPHPINFWPTDVGTWGPHSSWCKRTEPTGHGAWVVSPCVLEAYFCWTPRWSRVKENLREHEVLSPNSKHCHLNSASQ